MALASPWRRMTKTGFCSGQMQGVDAMAVSEGVGTTCGLGSIGLSRDQDQGGPNEGEDDEKRSEAACGFRVEVHGYQPSG